MNKNSGFAPWPHYSAEEIRAVTRVLRSGRVNQWTGAEVLAFEKEYARYLGVNHAVALANGSVALDIALLSLGIGPGDEVIVPCRSFVASASCVALRNAIPVFADVDRESQNVTVETIKPVCTKRTKAVIAVHLAGWPCDMDTVRDFCQQKGIFLIEDCAQAHGARYKGKPIGSFGDAACFSFCQDKIITTGGEGGLLATNDKEIWHKAWGLKDHGRDPDIMFNKKGSSGFVWAVEGFGTNGRLTEMQAAIGRIMLAKLDSWVLKRRKLSSVLTDGFKRQRQLRVTVPPAGIYHAYYKYYVFVRPQELKTGLDRNGIVTALNRKGIPCGCGVCPEIYREKAFVNYQSHFSPAEQERLPVAAELGETGIMFQVHPTLTEKNMDYIVREMATVLD